MIDIIIGHSGYRLRLLNHLKAAMNQAAASFTVFLQKKNNKSVIVFCAVRAEIDELRNLNQRWSYREYQTMIYSHFANTARFTVCTLDRPVSKT